MFFLNIKRMSEKALRFNFIKLNKKEFHKSKQPNELISVKVDQIVISDKCWINSWTSVGQCVG